MRRVVSHAALMMLLEAPTAFLSIPTLFLSKGRTMSDSLPVCTTVVLTILRLLSRSAYVTAAELARRLAAEGVSVQLRSLQRTLKIMSETPVYGVERNADHKPYGYRLAAPATLASAKLSPRDALLMRLTDESLGAALLLRLDEEVGEEAQKVMNERFERLKDREARRRVAVIPDLPLLTPPLLVPEVLDAVATALFRNAKLVFSYRDDEGTEHRLVASPLGVVRRLAPRGRAPLRADSPLLSCRGRQGPARAAPPSDRRRSSGGARPSSQRLSSCGSRQDAARSAGREEPGSSELHLHEPGARALARMLAETPFGPHQRIVRAGAKKFVLSVILPDSPRIYAWIALWKETGGITNATVEPLAKKSE